MGNIGAHAGLERENGFYSNWAAPQGIRGHFVFSRITAGKKPGRDREGRKDLQELACAIDIDWFSWRGFAESRGVGASRPSRPEKNRGRRRRDSQAG